MSNTMSKRSARASGCDGKRAFETKHEAQNSANCIRRHTEDRMHAYWCVFCRFYHVGHRGSDRAKRMTPHAEEIRESRRQAAASRMQDSC